MEEMGEAPCIKIKKRDAPAYLMNIDGEPDGKPWYYDILTYIKEKEYPPGAFENDKRTIRKLAYGFYLSGSTLYKRNHDSTLLRCVNAKESSRIIEEIHEGICGTHASGHVMARKILRMGYYWTKMEGDCIHYVRKCHKCQVYADEIHIPHAPLHVMSSPWPFVVWGIDVIGSIEPKASNGYRFILVAIDYFIKWVEAASYANITRSVVVKFIKEIICRYGLPERMIIDNAKNLNNKMMD
ncbi:unnamed protein product [Linum trigynum]|uniref:Integrase catalytic domain-containing protein n=1 Tax=Linum trigynum TaxID=586398 RepID=A0AAV2FR84_9ROSI